MIEESAGSHSLSNASAQEGKRDVMMRQARGERACTYWGTEFVAEQIRLNL